MTVDVLNRTPIAPASATKLMIADCDIHPVIRSLQESIYPYLSSRWRHHLETYGMSQRVAYQNGAPPYPKAFPNAARRDAWPPGGNPGTDLDFMRSQHLDAHNVTFAMCNPLMPSGQGFANAQLSTALCRATNEWQKHALVANDRRLRASVVVPYEDSVASVQEIDLRAGDADFAQVLLLSRTAEPLGQRRYWPIFEAAVRAGLPVAIHAFGYGGSPITSTGWPSYYIEEMTGHAQNAQALLNQAQVTLSYANVVSPISGKVNVRAARQGEVVAAGTPIVTITDLTQTWIYAPLPETEADAVQLGDSLRVVMPGGTTIQGKIIAKSAMADFATQRDVSRRKRDIKTIQLKLLIDNPGMKFVPGMTAEVYIPKSKLVNQ